MEGRDHVQRELQSAELLILDEMGFVPFSSIFRHTLFTVGILWFLVYGGIRQILVDNILSGEWIQSGIGRFQQKKMR
jgi:DNA replication protein DnaC